MHTLKKIGRVILVLLRIRIGPFFVLFITVLMAGVLDAASFSGRSPSRSDSSPFDVLYDRVHLVLNGGTIHKPAEGEASEIAVELYPLLLIESAESEPLGQPQWEWGVIERGTIRPGEATLYSATDTVPIRGVSHAQQRHLWFFRKRSVPSRPWNAQGLRITFARDGLPAIWEVLRDSTGANAVYVSEHLESAAREEFGAPLKGRRFSIENASDVYPDVIVARALGDGPIPMGPWVYLMKDTMDASTILCRCMASQVEGELDTAYYHLENINPKIESLRSTGGEIPAAELILPWLWPNPPNWIERILRLPADF